MDTLDALAGRWRKEAETLRRYEAEDLAKVTERHADELEAAVEAARLEALTLEKASDLGGYSYSHLHTLVSEGKIPNVGEKGSPRIRRCDVPRKPGHREARPTSKGSIMDRSLRLHRNGSNG